MTVSFSLYVCMWRGIKISAVEKYNGDISKVEKYNGDISKVEKYNGDISKVVNLFEAVMCVGR